MNQYFVVGRICDSENLHKLVKASSREEAEKKFEKHVRESYQDEDSDFYIDHCRSISEMQSALIR